MSITVTGGDRRITVDATTRAITVAPAGTPGADGAPGVGVPAGGTTGQVLAKTADTDFATGWSSTGGGGTSDHRDLTHRADADAHPLDAITGLQTALDAADPLARKILGEGFTAARTITPTGAFLVQPGDSAWDNYEIREPGQPIYDPVTAQWICVYAASSDTDYHVRAQAVVSPDAVTWTQHAQNPLTGTSDSGDSWADDPYLVKDAATNQVWRDTDNKAVMVIEELEAGSYTNRGITLWRSSPGTLSDWTFEARILDRGVSGAWDDQDRTSPTCVFDGTRLVLIFEGRQQGGQQGSTGLAFSDDEGATWTVQAEPILTPSGDGGWNTGATVPDDLQRLPDGRWIIFCHGFDDATYQWANIGRFWTTDDPEDWTAGSWSEMLGNPITHSTVTLMPFAGDISRAIRVEITGLGLEVVDVDRGVYGFIDELQHQVGALQSDMTAVQSDVTAVQSDVDTAQTDVTALQADRWVRGDGLGDGATVADATSHAVAVTGTMVDASGSNPTLIAFDPSSDLDLPDVSLVLDWAAPPGSFESAAIIGVPASVPGAELLGVRLSGVTATGGDLDSVTVTALIADGASFATLPASIWRSANLAEQIVILADPTAVDAFVAGVSGAVIVLDVSDRDIAAPASIEVASVEVLSRPIIGVAAHAASHADGGVDEIAVDASQITSGTISTARLGTGTADGTVFLRGDQTWAVPPESGSLPVLSADVPVGMDQSGPTVGAPATWTAGSTTANSMATIGLCPIIARRTVRFDRAAIYLKTAGTDTGCAAYVGICPSTPAGLPDYSSAVSLGTISLTGSAGLRTLTLSPNLELGEGVWWVMFAPYTAGTTTGTNPVFIGSVLSPWVNAVYLESTASYGFELTASRAAHGNVTAATGLVWTASTGYTAPRVGLRVAAYP